MRVHGRRAFTLMEIVASISLFSVIALGIASAIRDTAKLSRKLKSREARTLSGQIALDRLQRDLQAAFNERLQNSQTIFKSRNIGAGPELTFSYFDSSIKTLFERRTPGIKVAQYSVENVEGGGLNLYRAEVPLYQGEEIDDAPQRLIASGVMEWELEFYDARNDKWMKEWDTKSRTALNYFPKAVRVILETVDDKLPPDKWKDKSIRFETSFVILNELEGQ